MSRSLHASAFVGFGQSRIFRHDDVALGDLAVEACLAAIDDAGLSLSGIDGVTCVPDPPFAIEGTQGDGVHYVSTNYLIDALGLTPQWQQEVHGAMLNASAIAAINAVETGQCRTALVFRALHSPSGRYGHTAAETVGGGEQFSAPYGCFAPAMLAAQPWQAYRDRYNNGTREQMATFVCQARQNGLLYKDSYWANLGGGALTVEDYLAARIISTPACIYDCDIPVQGVGAFIVTTNERARDLVHPPAYVRGVAGSTIPLNHDVAVITLDTELASARSTAETLWADSGLSPADIDVADIYDGFSMITMCWLEGMGFCGEGEVFDYIQGGRIAMDGELPLNPSGGNLGAGRLHGCNHLMDAIFQVTDRAQDRQVNGAEVALAAVGPPSMISGAILLGREAP